MKSRSISFLLMCMLVITWGMDFIVSKQVLGVLQPMNLLFLKYFIGMIIVLVIKLKTDRKSIVRKRDIPFFIICSITGEILYFFCEYTAMDYLPVSLISIILAFVPAISILIERIFLKKKFTARMMIGVIGSIVGVAIIIGADFGDLAGGRLIGYILAFGAVISWNIYNFITSKISESYSSPSMALNQLVCTVLIIAPYALHTMPSAKAFTPGIIGGIIYLGLINAGIGFMIVVRSLKTLGPTITAMFSNFMPVTTTFFGWLFLSESIGVMQIIGGAIVIAAACFVIREKGKLEERLNGGEAESYNVD